QQFPTRDAGTFFSLLQVVEELANRHKPTALRCQAGHKPLKISIDLTVDAKAARKMGVHNTHPFFSFQPVLAFFRYHLAEPIHCAALTAAEPVVYVRLTWIVIGHGRIDAIQVDLLEHEIPYIADPFAADIAPKVARSSEMSLEVATPLKAGRKVIRQFQGATV